MHTDEHEQLGECAEDGRMQFLVPMKSILTPEGRRCNHRSGIFGTAVSSCLRGPDLALEKARSDLRRCKILIPESSCQIGVGVLAPGMAAKVQIRNQRM